MRLTLLLVFIAVPLLEIAILIKLGQWLGFWSAFAIVVLTAVVGTTVLHRQGLQTLLKVQQALAAGRPPIGPVVDGAMLIAAGLLLLTPGLVTDSLGLLLLVPGVRGSLARWGLEQLKRRGLMHVHVFRERREPRPESGSPSGPEPGPRPPRPPSGDGPVIEGEFERLDERPATTDDQAARRRRG
jgi:UPF0716 protein FxsA